MAVGLEVTDNGLDSPAATEFPLDGAEDAALLARAEHAERLGRIVAALAFVDVDALDLSPG